MDQRELAGERGCNYSSGDDPITILVQEARSYLGKRYPVSIEFYRYTTLRCTIRKRNNAFHIRLSHFLEDAPLPVLKASVASLSLRYQGRPHGDHDLVFRNYTRTDEMRKIIDHHRKRYARKRIFGPTGRYFDLEETFIRMNKRFFKGTLMDITITWGGKSKRTLGHYDHAKRIIVVSSLLDGPTVPGYVVDYVVYHEMLHHEYPTRYKNGRRVIHSRSFKDREIRFPDFQKAKDWVKKNFNKLH